MDNNFQSTLPLDPVPWFMLRMNLALALFLLENRIYGPVNTLLGAVFWNTLHWMIKPQPALREVIGVDSVFDDESESDSESGSDDSDMFHMGFADTTHDSQRNPVLPDRRKGCKPDFAVSKFTQGLHSDIHHLYVEIKNGEEAYQSFRVQIERYLKFIVKAIPPEMEHSVVVMLINGMTTVVWHLRRGMDIPKKVFTISTEMVTNGPEMVALLQSIADR